MFGNIMANFQDLDEKEKARYQSLYCGLCRSIKDRYGQASRLSLSYDLTFFVLLFNSLYEPEESAGLKTCIMHPLEPHAFSQSEYSEYAADLTVLMAYHKCLDDWNDEKKISARSYGQLLKRSYNQARKRRPYETSRIEQMMKDISALEKEKSTSLDAAAALFGELMGELFASKQDHWAPTLYSFGDHLGRFIYMMDAAIDFEEDSESGSYNPFVLAETSPEDRAMMLTVLIGNATEAFEKLPLVQDAHLLRSVLYAGVWQQYNSAKDEKTSGEKEQKSVSTSSTVSTSRLITRKGGSA